MGVSNKTLKYLKMLEEPFNKNTFHEFIKDLLNLENVDIVNGVEKPATSEQYKNYIESSSLFAKYEDIKRNSIGVFIIKLKNNKHVANARTLQRNYIAHLLDGYNLDACLAAVYSETENTWRLSFVKQEIAIEVGKFKKKVSPAKRYSYLFGKDEPNHTAKEQLVDFIENNTKKYSVDELEEKFSVEKVTKDFFEKYKENYLKLKEKLELNEEFLSESKRCDFTSEEFTKKLMGQLVFLYFLQKKGWLGVKLVPSNLTLDEFDEIYSKQDTLGKKILDKYYINYDNSKKIKNGLLEKYKENLQDIDILSSIFAGTKYEKPWGSGEKRFIRKIFDNCVNRNKNFFDDYLEPFFYDGLNHKRKNQYFSTFNCKIPFLNGGLFEPLDNYMWESSNFNLSNDIFAEILDFFDRYNFTMNEEEPLEKDVAVDPEMLGKIFENLLDVKDRKSKGAFYTPREIVHYMCQESLANYLVNKIGVKYEEIKEFIQYGEIIRDVDLKEATKNDYLVGETIFKNIIKIDNALKNIKVADPAVGSGAFPLGMLNEIVKLRDILTSYMLIYNREHLFNRTYSENEITSNNRTIYKIKWETIKNCIYAVDIENSAVDITKLRLWLSIVVDQEPNVEPEPLPNLDCKIMQGNSLIDEYFGIKLIDEKFIEELKDRDNVKFNDGSVNKKGKKIFWDNQIQFGDGQKKVQIDDLIILKQELYGTNDPNRKKEILDKINFSRKELLRLNFIGTNKVEELENLDNSHNKPYFAWKLEFIEVFIENDGFDIVIGNPPYVGEKGNKEIFQQISCTAMGKKYYLGKMDLFYFFFHKGIDILKNKGTLQFITTNYFITADGGLKLRADLYNRTNILRFINFNEFKIFSSAKGQHNMISLIEKDCESSKEYECETIITNRKGNVDDNIDILKSILYKSDTSTNYYKLKNKDLYDGKEKYIRLEGINNIKDPYSSILNKIIEFSNGNLGDYCNVNVGMLTGADKLTESHKKKYNINFEKNTGIFILTDEELGKLQLNEEEKKCIVPWFKNSDINKYTTNEENHLWLINISYPFIDILNKETYPNIYNHISKFKDILENRKANDGGMQKIIHDGRWWAFLMRQINFSAPKIVVPQRSATNKFGYNEKTWYASFDVYFITDLEEKKVELKYILGLLNSNLYYYWLYKRGKRKGEYLELYRKPLMDIPIKIANKNDMEEVIDIVNKLIEYSKNNYDIEELQKDLDKKIYQIYNLNEEEIKLLEVSSNE